MFLFLLDLIYLIIKLIFNFIKIILTLFIKLSIFILKTPILRFTMLIISLGLIFKLRFNLVASTFFLYLAHLGAINFNIYKKIKINTSYFLDTLINSSKISKSLKSLKNENIVLNNLHLENSSEEVCSIDDLVITDGGIFVINTLKSPYENYKVNNSTTYSNILNDDEIIDNNLLYSVSEQCNICNNVLTDILSSEIPITNIIALPNDNSVILDSELPTTPIITASELPFYINRNIDKSSKYSPTIIKYSVLENRVWILERILMNSKNFLNLNKSIIFFICSFIMLYYVYITFLTYLFYKFIKH